MSVDYTIDRAEADAMLEEFGQAVTLTHRAAGAYDPATGTAAITETTQAASAVIFDFAPGLRKMAGENIAAGDRQCYLSALKSDGTALTRPSVNDTLTDANGLALTIVAVSELSPAGVDILYELTVRATA